MTQHTHIHNNIMWDWQQSTKMFPNVRYEHGDYLKLFYEILSIPQNIIIDLDNVTKGTSYILGQCVNLVKPLPFWLEGGIDIAVMVTMNP